MHLIKREGSLITWKYPDFEFFIEKNDWFLIATSISIAFKGILSLKSTKNDYFAFSKIEIFGQVKCIDHKLSTMTASMT